MPAWSVEQRISPRRFREVGLIIERPNKQEALDIAEFILDVSPKDLRLIPHH